MSFIRSNSKPMLSRRSQWAGGQPISELMAQALANPSLLSLAAGFVDNETLPVEPTAKALETLMSSPAAARAALQYGTTAGYAPLREKLLADLLAADGLSAAETEVTLDQVVVTAGSNQLLHLVGESLLDPGDLVMCAAPTYLVFLGTLANLGAKSYGVASDQQGMIPASLTQSLQVIEKQGELARVKAIYLVTYFDNPAGSTMPLERKAEIVEIAQRFSRHGSIYVIEDAAYRELRYEGNDVPSARTIDPSGKTVITAGTFSKSYSPGIRVGWGIMPSPLAEAVCNQKGNIDFGSPNFSQQLMNQVLDLGLYRPHVDTIRAGYAEKMHAMLQAARDFLAPLPGVRFAAPKGGLYIWVELPPELQTGPQGTLFDTAVAEGMLYVPGEYCYPAAGQPVRRSTMRLSFGVQSPENIRQGMKALAAAIEKTTAGVR